MSDIYSLVQRIFSDKYLSQQLNNASLMINSETFKQAITLSEEFKKKGIFTKDFFSAIHNAIAANNFVDKFNAIMLEIDFPPLLEVELDEMKEIVAFYEKNGVRKSKTKIESYIESFYNNEVIQGIIEDWYSNEIVKKRIEVFKEILANHSDQRYFSSISLLIAQYEGTIVDKFNYKGKMKGKEYQELRNRLFKSKISSSFDKNVDELFNVKILCQFEHGQTIGSPLSRHAIVHGSDTAFGTKINSIRCILIYDYIIKKLDWIVE
ncbi:hypothetical protein EEL30_21975 [Brevibacillus laterosporus]|uniref:Uncharacterized protein n=1 Tax=Brevibacillus laterosporus TaxID=1465 RepID=A0A518VCJ3_BRELA|nr:hypothetical protein EEL30_21975 [Brevibacillus laterosporus]